MMETALFSNQEGGKDIQNLCSCISVDASLNIARCDN